MQLYNTMTRRKEEFVPLTPGKAGIYACGITAYDLSHIGHARSAVVFDVLVRYLRYRGLEVTFVRNFTDVDDKIIARANREGKTCEDIAQTYIDAFHEDMDKLNVLRPDIEPRATAYIGEMQEMIRSLIDQGHAYAVEGGDVYFRVRSFKEYGKLSGRDVDELRAGARIAVGEAKEDPLDFALWKAAKPGEPYWESPWGKGRPGWHLECSAMSRKNLCLPLDIHGGGQDLVFPHHENEIAQSEAATGKEFARFWMHNGFVQINSEKMSKSLNNFKTIRDILEHCQPETLRYFLLSKQYRGPIDFSFDVLDDNEKGLKRIYETLRDAELALSRPRWKPGGIAPAWTEEFDSLRKGFFAAMDDDLNTAGALGCVFGTVRLVNRLLEDKAEKSKEGCRDLLGSFLDLARAWAGILGVFCQPPQQFLLELREVRAKRRGIDVAKIGELMDERVRARAAKDYAAADLVRSRLAEMGVEVRDTPGGAVWDIT